MISRNGQCIKHQNFERIPPKSGELKWVKVLKKLPNFDIFSSHFSLGMDYF